MPYVNIQVTKGLSRQQKRELVHQITDSISRILSKKSEHTHIVIQEIEEANWGYDRMLTDEWRLLQEQENTKGKSDHDDS